MTRHLKAAAREFRRMGFSIRESIRLAFEEFDPYREFRAAR